MAKQKGNTNDAQQSLFDDFVDAAAKPQTNKKQQTDKSENKSVGVSLKKKIKESKHNAMVPKGRKPIFVVDDMIRSKYPFIRHQPAVLMDYRNIVDVVVRDGNNEYWLGVDRYGNEVLPGSFDKKIPAHLKEAVAEYIANLKVV